MRWQIAITIFVCFTTACYAVPMKVINKWGSGENKWFEGECVVNVPKRKYIGQWTMAISLSEDTKDLQLWAFDLPPEEQDPSGRWYILKNKYEYFGKVEIRFQLKYGGKTPSGECINDWDPKPSTPVPTPNPTTVKEEATTSVEMKIINKWGSGRERWIEAECNFNIIKRKYIGQWKMNITLNKNTQGIKIWSFKLPPESKHKRGKWYYLKSKYEYKGKVEVRFQLKHRGRPPKGQCISNIPPPPPPTTLPPTLQPTMPPTSQPPPQPSTDKQPTLPSTSLLPTLPPSSQVPTMPPTGQPPTLLPTDQPPTLPPTSQLPTLPPSSQVPTMPPTGQPPTLLPTDQPPTLPPTSQLPTLPPSSQVPTMPPTGQPPTLLPTDQPPTLPPTSQLPTLPPSSQVPTMPPTGQPPTQPPTWQPPTLPPTDQPPTLPPTAQPPTMPPTSHPPTIPSTTDEPTTFQPTLPPALQTKYNYTEALKLSILFYEAQRSGPLPTTNRISYRGDSALSDGADNGVDLTGGWYDAGDGVKFNFPMAASTTILATGFIFFEDAYERANQKDLMYESIKWPLDYFLKCWKPDTSNPRYYAQVGSGVEDHKYWGRHEDMTMSRPSYYVDKNSPGSDVAGETAAAMAAGSMVFAEKDPDYSNRLLTAAESLYDFAITYKGKYSDSISDAAKFYNSFSGYQDELCLSSILLYMASGKNEYLKNAELYSTTGTSWALSWDEKTVLCQSLLALVTNEEKYKAPVRSFIEQYMPGGNVHQTPCGLAWRDQWGSLRYSANTAFIALIAADLGIANPDTYKSWAMSQIHYALGENKFGSFLIGFGKKYPERPHHRASSCPPRPSHCTWDDFNNNGPNPNILYGALVGGPKNDDGFTDDRKDYITNEVTTDYNAGFQSAVAGLIYFAMNDDLPDPPVQKCYPQ